MPLVFKAEPGAHVLTVLGGKPDEWTIEDIFLIPVIAWEVDDLGQVRPVTVHYAGMDRNRCVIEFANGTVHMHDYKTGETLIAKSLADWLHLLLGRIEANKRAIREQLAVVPAQGSA